MSSCSDLKKMHRESLLGFGNQLNIKESQIVFLYRKDLLIQTECLQYYT